MTREEAISILKQYIDYNNPDVPDFYTMEEAIEVVIKALKQEPCDDAISRQAVAEVLLKYAHSAEGKAFAEFLISQINDLPPVTPQYTDAEIQKMQDLESVEIQTAYEIGKAESGSEKPNKWVSVLDQLPEKEGLYIVTREYPWGSAMVDTSYWFKTKPDNHGFSVSDRVIAWMPIEPYKASPTGAERSDKE